MRFVDPVASGVLVRRHLIYQRHAWAAVVTALVEPAVYFAAVLVGVSHFVEGGVSADYLAYAGPALLSVTVMNGAVAECTNNVFFRWRQGRLYDAVLCTPVTGRDIAVADLAFGALRGWVSGIAFLLLLVPFLDLSIGAALILVACAAVIAVLFAALALLVVTYLRSWRQLQMVQLAVFVMFVAANTFADLGSAGALLGAVGQVLPLTHANELARSVVAGDGSTALRELAVTGVLALVLAVLAVRRAGRVYAD